MTAICKVITVHGGNTVPLINYCANKEKTSISKNLENPTVANLLNYGANPLKTICGIDENHKELLITGIGCTPESAAEEFELTHQKYLALKGTDEEYNRHYKEDSKFKRKKPVTAIHLIQSFSETDIDPHIVHEIGIRLAESIDSQSVVDTHLNKEHLHNHIVINAYTDKGKKVLCNKDFIMNIRERSDEIQKEFGIPIEFTTPREQLYKKMAGGKDWAEWNEEINGNSWKAQMKESINTIMEVSKSKEEYLELMENYGYSVVKEHKNFITFLVKENGKKITDKSLGKEYTIGALFPEGAKNFQENSAQFRDFSNQKKYSPLFKTIISVSLYDSSGRRRGPLELLIREVIAIIQKVGNFFFSSNPEYSQFTPDKKLEMMNNALDIIKKRDIFDIKDLENKVNKTGTELGKARKVLTQKDTENEIYIQAENAINDILAVKNSHFNVSNLSIHEYSESDIRKTKAKLSPMTPKQKHDLSRELGKNEKYRMTCKFDEISCSEAETLLRFLRDDSLPKPPYMLTLQEFQEKNIQKQLKTIYDKRTMVQKEKYNMQKPSSNQLNYVTKLLNSRGITTNTDELSLFDVINIRNCFSPNPFSSALLTEKQQETLKKIVSENNLKLNRPINHITSYELNEIMNFTEKKVKSVPGCLRQERKPSNKDLKKLEGFMNYKGISSTVPINELSMTDYNSLFTYVVCTGNIPEIFIPPKEPDNIDRDNEFFGRIENMNPQKSIYLAQTRTAYNTLKSLGFDIHPGSLNETEEIAVIKEKIDSWKKDYTKAAEDKQKLSDEYADLLKVKQATRFAKDKAFLYGDAYASGFIPDLRVEEKAERDVRSPAEDEKQRREKPKEWNEKDFR